MDQTEEKTLREMSSFRFSEPITITILFEDSSEETQTSNRPLNDLDFQTDEIFKNIDVTQLLNTSSSLSSPSHIETSSNVSNSTKETHDVQMRPNTFFESYKDASNQFNPSLQQTILGSDAHHTNHNPSMFHQCSYFTKKQMSSSKGLSLPKSGPIIRATAKTSNVQSESVRNSTIRDGLDILSNNLVNIIWWKHYLKEKGATQFDERQYQYKRKKFFWLSYPIVKDKILPRQHDSVFIRNFLIKTLSMLYAKLSITTSYESIAGLFRDMLEWVKHYKKPVANKNLCAKSDDIHKPTSQSNNNSRSCLNNLTDPYVENCTSLDKTLTCLFSLQAPGGEVTINVDSNLLQNHQTESLPKGNNRNCPIRRNENLNKTGVRQTSPKQLHRQPCNSNKESVNSTPTTFEWVDNVLGTNNRITKSAPEPLFRPPIYNNQYENSQSYNQVQNETETFRSSISRDSGFASPHRDFAANQMNEIPTNEREQNEGIAPLVSLVTSWNQNATYITPGACRVCGVTTKNMCMGCYKNYYCNSKCQLADWSNHWFYCAS